MKRPYQKRASKRVMIITLAIPILLCAVIILGLFFGYLKFAGMEGTPAEASAVAMENACNSQSMVLSLIGIAISVWIGLNIYNVLSKEELRSLLDQAEHVAEITERIYTEVLISKLRLSSGDGSADYLAVRLEVIDKLPDTILEVLIALEDLFSFSYGLYADGLSSQYNEKGEKQAEQLIESIKKHKKNGDINSEQYSFLMGYISLRWGDFAYFRAQHEKHTEEELSELARNIITRYRETAFSLFGIRNITLCTNPELYQPQERQSIAFLANNIGSAYLLFMPHLDNEELTSVIATEEVAIAFSEEIAPPTLAIFVRNLGVAYEKKGEMEEAFKQYCKSFQLNRKNPKTAHCIGSWYRKQIYKRFPNIPSSLIIDKNQISSFREDEKDDLLQMLKQSAYWYEFKRSTNNGMVEDWLITLYQCMNQLTNDERLKEKLGMLQTEKKYLNAVLSSK